MLKCLLSFFLTIPLFCLNTDRESSYRIVSVQEAPHFELGEQLLALSPPSDQRVDLTDAAGAEREPFRKSAHGAGRMSTAEENRSGGRRRPFQHVAHRG